MKLSLLFVGLLSLCSCAVGTTDPEDTSSPTTSAPVQQRPAPIPADTASPPENHQCHTESEWVDNCLVTTTICVGKPVRVDVMCSSDGAWLFPWKNIPDPPPPWVDRSKKDNSK